MVKILVVGLGIFFVLPFNKL